MKYIGNRNFFEDRLNVFLMSDAITLDTFKVLLEAFEKRGGAFHRNNHLLMSILLQSIIHNLKICDGAFIGDLIVIINNIELIEPNPETCALIASAFLFVDYFALFEMDYTFERFISETK